MTKMVMWWIVYSTEYLIVFNERSPWGSLHGANNLVLLQVWEMDTT